MANPPSQTDAPDTSARVDRDLVTSAYRKLMDKQDLTKQERAALKRHEKEKEERLRWQHYASISQKHWREMSGRQTKVINEQAARYGIPFGGASINLPAVVRAFHDFLADNAVKLARDDDALMQGNGSPALERYREERTALVRLDRLEREGELVAQDDAREVLGRVAAVIRGVGEALQRRFGAEAADILYEGMDEAEREIARFYSATEQGTAIEPERELEHAAEPEPSDCTG